MLSVVRRVHSENLEQQTQSHPFSKRFSSQSAPPTTTTTNTDHNRDHNNINTKRLNQALAHFENRYPGEVITTLRTFKTSLIPTLSLSLLSVPSLSFTSFRDILLDLPSLSPAQIQLFFEKLSVLVAKHFRRGNHLKKKGFPKGGKEEKEDKTSKRRRSGKEGGGVGREVEGGKWSREEVIVLYLSTLKYVHVILGLNGGYLEDNYGSFHFSLCFNVLADLIPELRQK